jgi:hypothetical protein
VTYDADQLYNQLPGVYRRRDAEIGEPLRALLGVITEQVAIVEDDIAQLYDDWFIETCQDWVVPYIGDLVGYRMLNGFDEALTADTAEARLLLPKIAPRSDVGHTVANRRRKGALALLENLAADVASWPARAVEARRLLAVLQCVRLRGDDPHADRRRNHRGGLADLHNVNRLDLVDGPFDSLAHTVTVSLVTSHRRRRLYDIPEVGLYVWRLVPYSITHGPAFCDDRNPAHYWFSALGNDTPLLNNPVREPSPTHVADDTNVPSVIRRRAFTEAIAQYYGPQRSLYLWADGEPITLERIVSADLTDWRYRPVGDQVAIDPVLGRIAFPARRAPDAGVWVNYHYGFSAEVGGGEYPRPPDSNSAAALYRVGPDEQYHAITDAIAAWRADIAAATGDEQAARRRAIVEITDTGEYNEQITISLDHRDHLTVRAATGVRPVIRLQNMRGNRPDALRIVGTGQGAGHPPRIVLDGLLITGRSVRVHGDIGQVIIRHTTLVPGWTLDEHCCAEHEDEPSLELVETFACVQVDKSILGTVIVIDAETADQPSSLFISDSVVDAAAPGLDAIAGPDGGHAYVVLTLRRCTVFGAVRAHAVATIENCILGGQVLIARRQDGCARFSWLPPGSRTPARFHCEPETSGDPNRVRPVFTSTRYGTPGYAQLSLEGPDEIGRGADDGSEMGAFHDLFQPQRADNLRLRLDEYTPAGCDAGLIFVN